MQIFELVSLVAVGEAGSTIFRIYKQRELRQSPVVHTAANDLATAVFQEASKLPMTTMSQTYPTLIGRLWPARTNQALRWIVLMIAGSLFVALCAQIQVPMVPVPMTMQTFAALVIGMAFGARLGAATLALYLVEGAVGLPFFAGFSSGLFNLASGGYIIGFILAAGLVGWLAERGWDRNVFTTALAMLIGNALIYVPGLLWLATFVPADKVLAYGLTPFLVGDLVKLLLAATALPLAWKLVGRPKA